MDNQATENRSLMMAASSGGGPCRVCGGTIGKYFTANQFEWFDCDSCSTLQKVLTYPEYLELNPSYDPGAYLDGADRSEIETFLRVEDLVADLKRFIQPNIKIGSPADSPGSFLDVGCGMGAYLLAARRLGFDVTGFEPSQRHAHVAIAHLGLPVVADYFSVAKVDNKKFDVIMLSHVIEHIYSPREFLHDLVSVLKPGGTLIVVTPNRDSIVSKATGRKWPMLKPVDHVTMICANTYAYFGLEGSAKVHHHYSEYSYEFAATVAAVLKASWRREDTANASLAARNEAPPLQTLGFKAKLLKGVLTGASIPALLLARGTERQACLTSVVVRNS